MFQVIGALSSSKKETYQSVLAALVNQQQSHETRLAKLESIRHQVKHDVSQLGQDNMILPTKIEEITLKCEQQSRRLSQLQEQIEELLPTTEQLKYLSERLQALWEPIRDLTCLGQQYPRLQTQLKQLATSSQQLKEKLDLLPIYCQALDENNKRLHGLHQLIQEKLMQISLHLAQLPSKHDTAMLQEQLAHFKQTQTQQIQYLAEQVSLDRIALEKRVSELNQALSTIREKINTDFRSIATWLSTHTHPMSGSGRFALCPNNPSVMHGKVFIDELPIRPTETGTPSSSFSLPTI